MARAVYAQWDEDDAFGLHDERPARRVRKRRLPWFRIFLLSAVSITGLVYFAQRQERAEPSAGPKTIPSSVLIAPAPAWRPVSPTPAIFSLEKGLGPVTMEARQHTSGAREDSLILNAFGDVPHARITLSQGFAEAERGFFVDMVRRAAQAGLSVARNGMSRMVATKFGSMEAAPMTLAGLNEQNCQAFRFADPEAGFGFHGWLCGSDAGSMDDAQLSCFIDRIALAGGTNPSLKAAFARAERRRGEACAPAARTASITPKSGSQR